MASPQGSEDEQCARPAQSRSCSSIEVLRISRDNAAPIRVIPLVAARTTPPFVIGGTAGVPKSRGSAGSLATKPAVVRIVHRAEHDGHDEVKAETKAKKLVNAFRRIRLWQPSHSTAGQSGGTCMGRHRSGLSRIDRAEYSKISRSAGFSSGGGSSATRIQGAAGSGSTV